MIVDWDASRSEIKKLLHPKTDNSFLSELNGILIFIWALWKSITLRFYFLQRNVRNLN